MFAINWTLFWVLFTMGMVGAVGVIPYTLSISGDRLAQAQAKLPLPVMLVIGAIQNGILLAVAIWLGLLFAQAAGLDMPILSALASGEPVGEQLWVALGIAAASGLLFGMLIAVLDGYFQPRLPEALRSMEKNVSPWQAVLASFYGGISEEIFLRLFVMSGLAWLLARFWHTAQGLPTNGVFWAANLLAALLFGIGHLPATRAVTPLTPLVVTRGLFLNGLVGVLCGLLFWQFGLLAAMAAHFTLDLVIHVFWPILKVPSDRSLTVDGKTV